MAGPTLYLFDGSNMFHAGGYADRQTLIDNLASFVALEGVRGVVVFDGHGEDHELGALEVRFRPHADDLLERLAADNRNVEEVLIVTSDGAVRGTAGPVGKRGSRAFLDDLPSASHRDEKSSRVRDSLDAGTLAALERLRRGETP